MEIDSYQPGTPCWVDLSSPDPAAAERFYARLFGWTVVSAGEGSGGYRLCEVRDRVVAGIGPLRQEGVPAAWSTYVAVSDADATARAVRDAGGEVHVEPTDVMDEGRMAVFADPAGAVVAAWQPGRMPGAGLVDEPGALCWNELATRDPDRAREFYAAVFGWQAQAREIDGMTYTTWQLGDRVVGGMIAMGDDWPPEVPPHWSVCFAVRNCDAAAEEVRALGGAVLHGPVDIEPGRFAAVGDPQGAGFAVLSLRT
ncbi:VOC family protein [Saccharopolyspora rosea]|uniref:VOC family protein n=1 Tax=Saccharopolyspora rosea TaxID=524884 RepID=A0ABW3FMG2_9PSEU|nr:VOC family protein [Saccharopolyspora rosea]